MVVLERSLAEPAMQEPAVPEEEAVRLERAVPVPLAGGVPPVGLEAREREGP